MVARTITPQILYSLPSNSLEEDCACADIPAMVVFTNQAEREYHSGKKSLLQDSTKGPKNQEAVAKD